MGQKDKKLYTIIQLNSTIEEFVGEVCKQVKFFCEHHYIKNSEAIYPEHCKSTLLDFAKNYSFIIQGVFQGCYWNNSQATPHPFVI